MDYHFLREFADSWMLIAMFLFFVCAIAWAFRPGSSETYRDAGAVPFRHEDRPLGDPAKMQPFEEQGK
jgi:cytochrome c oxidase cbb3-type subunit 4